MHAVDNLWVMEPCLFYFAILNVHVCKFQKATYIFLNVDKIKLSTLKTDTKVETSNA